MASSLVVSTSALPVSAAASDPYSTISVFHGGGAVVYYGGPNVTSVSNTGSLTAGQSLTLTSVTWFVSTGTASLEITEVPGSIGTSSARGISQLEVYGHSYASGSGASAGAYRYATKVAKALGATEQNFGTASAKLALDDQTVQGGYYAVGTKLPPSVRPVANGPFPPRAQVCLFNYGYNDVTGIPFTHAIRAALCHLRAGVRFDASDASISGTGTFGNAPSASSRIGVGAQLKGSQTGGETLTVTVPATFQGGEICLYWESHDTGGAIIDFTIDGVSSAALDARTLGTGPVGRYSTAVKRFPGLAPGAHTIVATLRIGFVNVGNTWFESWSIQSNPTPLIVVLNVNRTPTKPIGTTQPLSDNIASVVAEFDVQVQLLDADATIGVLPPATVIAADNVHPNDYGHTLLAQAAYNLITSTSKGFVIPPTTNLLTA